MLFFKQTIAFRGINSKLNSNFVVNLATVFKVNKNINKNGINNSLKLNMALLFIELNNFSGFLHPVVDFLTILSGDNKVARPR